MERKSLKIVLEDKSLKFEYIDLLRMCLEVGLAVYYMHTRKPPVYHRDLKSSNCLVDSNFRVKLCDFG